MVRTTLASFGFRRRRVALVLTHAEWALLEEEADRQHEAVGTVTSRILGLSIANRDHDKSLTQQARDDSARRGGGRGSVR